MKVLSICGFFQLPDDFDGSRTEALELLVKYRASKGYSGNVTGKISDIVDDTQEMWELFLDTVETTEYKWVGDITVAESDPEGNWKTNSLEPLTT